MNKTIIINRAVSEAELEDIKLLVEEGAKVYTLSRGESLDFAEPIVLSAEDKRKLNYQTMDEVLHFGDLPVGDRSVADLFRIDNASIWHYQKFRIYFAVRNLMYFLSPVRERFASFDNHTWYVSNEVRYLRNLYPKVEYVYPEEGPKDSFNFGILFSYAFLLIIRSLVYAFSSRKKPEYLLYMTEKYSTVMDKKTLKTRSGHHILDYLISELDHRFALLTEVLMPKSKGRSDYSFSTRQYHRSLHHCPKIFLEGFMIGGLLNKQVRQSTLGARRQLKMAYPKVRLAELTLTQQLTLEVFRALHSSSGFFLFRYFAARRFFAHTSVKAVIAGDENSPLTKSILDAARFNGIRVIGLQHGTMHDLHPAYLYTPKDRENHIVPDLTLTWGTYWEQFLIEKGNYPADSVVSVGQIRTDIIPLLMKAQNQKQAHPTEVILFASQPQRDPELRYQAAFDVFKAARKLPNTKLIVKLHPREFADSPYYSGIATEAGCTNYVIDKTSDLYQLIAKEAGCSNYVIDKTSDLYQLIASCDVLITCFSTVGTETVYFYKPLVILDHLKQDIQGYAAEGVAFQATDADTLASILSGIFRGALRVNRDKYNSFIMKYACQIDGKVAQRCIQAITAEDHKN